MIRLESSGSDCPMGMSFRGKGVNPSYTHAQGMPRIIGQDMIAYYLHLIRCVLFPGMDDIRRFNDNSNWGLDNF